ncbi:MAG: helix-turn-helix domain-containing protein [Cyanothece sp. SIO1E1]|nr:helix-turn-helix domain-containing protein [Cyanothece sp. SIO1E1]
MSTTIRRFRYRRGISQRKVASLAGCSQSYISRLENSQIRLSSNREVITRICQVLEVPIYYLEIFEFQVDKNHPIYSAAFQNEMKNYFEGRIMKLL